MKIFLSFLQSKVNHPIPGYNYWQYYIKNGIEEAGHQWTEHPEVDWALGIVPKNSVEQNAWKQEVWGKTVTWLKRNPVDLFLGYLYPEQIDVNAINDIQKLGIPCVNFYCDNIRSFAQIPKEFACFDLNWVPEYQALPMYQKKGYAYLHLPMPTWVEPKFRTPQKESIEQLTFLGSKDIQRQRLFENIIVKRLDLPLKIYGDGWVEEKNNHNFIDYTLIKKLQFQYKFLTNNGIKAYLRKLNRRNIKSTLSASLKAKMQPAQTLSNLQHLTAKSRVTIGVNRYPSYHYPLLKPNTYSRLRDIEAPMLGACYLTEWTSGIELLYDLGSEIETYKDEDEFIQKAEMLMADTRKRKQLKVNGQKRALNTHSIAQSLNKLLAHLNIT